MDSKRSWAVAVACCWINAFSLLTIRSASVIYVEILETFSVTREQASWPLSLITVFYCLVGPIVGALANYIAIHKLISVGCLASGLAVAACYFANGIPYLIFFLGVTQGCALGLLCLCNTAISQHFHRYRAVASGISNAGFCIGGLILPPLVQLIFDEYGCRGALLICGAVMLNAAAGAILTRSPHESIVKPECSCQKNVSPNNTLLSKLNLQDLITVDSKQKEVCQTNVISSPGESNWKTPGESQRENTPSLARNGTVVEVEKKGPQFPHERCKTITTEGEHPSDQPEQFCTKLLVASKIKYEKVTGRGPNDRLQKLGFLLSPKFYLIAFSVMQIWFNVTAYLTIIVDFATDRNISRWNAVFLATFITAADLVARLGSGFITDRGLLGKNAMMATHLLLWAATLYLTPLCSSYACYVLTAIVMGWCGGATFILTAVFFMELVDPDAFSMCIGVASFVGGLPLLARPPLIGYYRDTLGDYEGLFHLQGTVSACIAVFWIFIHFKEKCSVCSLRSS
ncbi:unnamed protein product [Ixodes pacificus]